MNALVQQEARALAQTGGRMAVADIIQHVAVIQEVQRAVMKPDVHYGKIPGAGDKPTLFKAGAEVLCMVFHVADDYQVEDLSTADSVRYRITCLGKHQMSGVVLGSGLGEASSNEEKYKWRKAVCAEEWQETPANLRRVKHKRGRNNTTYKEEQVRTEPADIANTVLKMANKRAKIAMTLNVTAASDMFSQDLEDMDEALRDHLARKGDEPAQAEQQHQQQPAAAALTLPAWTDADVTKREAKIAEFYSKGKTADEIIGFYSTKATLGDTLKERIRSLRPAAPAADVQDVAPKVVYAQLADKIVHAMSLDVLSAAEDLIGELADPQQRADAVALANDRRAYLEERAR